MYFTIKKYILLYPKSIYFRISKVYTFLITYNDIKREGM